MGQRQARDFDSWDVCDEACQNLFRYTPFAWAMAAEWASAKREFVRRAGFWLMAGLAIEAAAKANDAPDEDFAALLPLLAAAATDPRNMVEKAVNWTLRAIGKRNPHLRRAAIAENIRAIDSPAARWIASDALRELRAVKQLAADGLHRGTPRHRNLGGISPRTAQQRRIEKGDGYGFTSSRSEERR